MNYFRSGNTKKRRPERPERPPIWQNFTPSIGTVIFGAVFLYIVISLVLYLTTSHVKSFQVTSGPLAKNRTYTGLAIREEQLVTADSAGYVTYYARANTRVKQYGAVYSVSSARNTEATTELSAAMLDSIRQDAQNFSVNFDPVNFHDTYSFKYKVEGDVLDNTVEMTEEYQKYAGSSAMTIGSQTISTSPADGIVSYTLDGYETYDLSNIKASDLDQKSYSEQDLKTQGQIKAGQNVYKLITSENWSLIIPLTSKQIVQLTDRSQIRVKFLSDGVTQLADFSILTMDDGSYYGKLDFSTGMLRYVDNRFIDIELVTNTSTGLKVPVTAIVSKEFFTIPVSYSTKGGDTGSVGFLKVTKDNTGKEMTVFTTTTLYDKRDDKYYVDSTDFKEGDIIIKDGTSQDRFIVRQTSTLEGVYNMNKGYAVFRKVNIIDTNEEYCLVEAGTRYGISQFDYIVKNGSDVRESDITA